MHVTTMITFLCQLIPALGWLITMNKPGSTGGKADRCIRAERGSDSTSSFCVGGLPKLPKKHNPKRGQEEIKLSTPERQISRQQPMRSHKLHHNNLMYVAKSPNTHKAWNPPGWNENAEKGDMRSRAKNLTRKARTPKPWKLKQQVL